MFNQSKAFAIALLVAVFVAGIAAGAAGTHWAATHRAPPRRPSRGFAERLTQELQLSTAQHDSVAAILRRYDPMMREIFARVRPEMDSLRLRLREEVRAQLTPGQQTAYQQMLERDSVRFSRRDSTDQRRERPYR